MTFDITMVDEDFFAEGQAFDGSSIAGWKAINESDMLLMPDVTTACVDPFFSETTLSVCVRRARADHGEPYGRDPRGIAKKAMAYLQSTASATPCSSAPRPSSSSSTT